MTTIVSRHFHSITDFARAVKQAVPVEEFKASTKPKNRNWDGGMDLPEAIDCAEKGGVWPEGAKNLLEAKIETDVLMKDQTAPAEETDVTGHTLDVGDFLAGVPDCWIGEGEEEECSAPIVVIGVQIGRRASVKSASVMRRGAAVLSLIDKLEGEGIRCELWALWANADHGYQSDFRVKVKGAEDTWSPDSVAFALGHPCFNRRLAFRLCESEPELKALWGSGYGRGVSRVSTTAKDFDVFLEWQKDNFVNAEAALRSVTTDFNQQLKSKKEQD